MPSYILRLTNMFVGSYCTRRKLSITFFNNVLPCPSQDVLHSRTLLFHWKVNRHNNRLLTESNKTNRPKHQKGIPAYRRWLELSRRELNPGLKRDKLAY